jgi:hypothetical protein
MIRKSGYRFSGKIMLKTENEPDLRTEAKSLRKIGKHHGR